MNKESKSNDWRINFRRKNKPRFKAGADLTDKVNLQVDIDETQDEASDSAIVKMKVLSDEKAVFDLKLEKSTKSRFKTGTELATKVNFLDVDWNQEVNETEEIMFIGIHLKSTYANASIEN